MSMPARAACVLALIASFTGCSGPQEPEGNRAVHARVDDRLYAAGAPLPGSTVSYPTRLVADETRVVLSNTPAGGTATSAVQPVRVELDIPAGAALELGYALGDVAPGTGVEFTISAVTPAKTVEILRKQLKAERDDAKGRVWHDARADLKGLEGKVTLELAVVADRADRTAEPDGVSPYGFFSAPIITKPAGSEPPRHVVLISVDTLRADRLGIYGYTGNTSPNIDRIFAERGVVVERYYTNAVDTLRAHAAMMTGLLPETALLAGQYGPALGAWTQTLAEMMRAAGYRTGAFTEDAWVAAGFGFRRGFERYAEEREAKLFDEPPGHVAEIFENGLEWLSAHRTQPTFLFLHTYETHWPYTPRKTNGGTAGGAQTKTDSELYDDEIRFVDAEFGRFVEAIEKLGIADDTWIILTSDHGEEFGEHGRTAHGTHLYEETLRVPLLLIAKGLPAGQRRIVPMSSVDLVPTLLGLLGLEPMAHLDGESHAAHIRDGAEMGPIAIYHEAHTQQATKPTGSDSTWIPPSYAVTTWPYRMIRIRTPEGARYELYDLVTDPAEKTNLYDELGKRFAFRKARIDRYAEFRGQRREEFRQKTAGTGAASAEPHAPDPAVSEKLRALGYVE